MQKEYYQIYLLLNELDQWEARLDKIQRIVKRPTFQYKKENGADIILSMFLKSSYWLDQELFNEDYLYNKNNQSLLPTQNTHLKMLDIGCTLIDKGFPLKYNETEYTATGPNQLGAYVKTFVNQCHKRHNFLNSNLNKNQPQIFKLHLKNMISAKQGKNHQ